MACELHTAMGTQVRRSCIRGVSPPVLSHQMSWTREAMNRMGGSFWLPSATRAISTTAELKTVQDNGTIDARIYKTPLGFFSLCSSLLFKFYQERRHSRTDLLMSACDNTSPTIALPDTGQSSQAADAAALSVIQSRYSAKPFGRTHNQDNVSATEPITVWPGVSNFLPTHAQAAFGNQNNGGPIFATHRSRVTHQL